MSATKLRAEEAILNALLAAQSVPTFKPAGLVLEALEHGQLLELLREYRRLPDPKDP
jgi:D-aminopeptidase